MHFSLWITNFKCRICRLPLSSEDLSRNRFDLLGICGYLLVYLCMGLYVWLWCTVLYPALSFVVCRGKKSHHNCHSPITHDHLSPPTPVLPLHPLYTPVPTSYFPTSVGLCFSRLLDCMTQDSLNLSCMYCLPAFYLA